MSATTLLERLDGIRSTGLNRWLARCPSHDDRRPSLSVRELDDGRVLLKCWTGCDAESVLSAVGLTFRDVAPDAPLGDRIKGEKRPFPAADVLKAIAFEALLVYICAADMGKGKTLSEETRQRLLIAADRIQVALWESGYDKH